MRKGVGVMTNHEAYKLAYSISMPHRAKVVLQSIASFSNRKNCCFPSVRSIARRAQISVSTAHRAIADLIALGLITKVARTRSDGGDSSNFYVLRAAEPQTVEQADRDPCIKLTHEVDTFSNILTVIDGPAREAAEQETPKETIQAGKGQAVNCTPKQEPGREIPLERIMENCELHRMPPECRLIFRDAVTRLYYSEQLRIGKHICLPQPVVRTSLRYLDRRRLESAWSKLTHVRRNKDKPIINQSQYAAVLLYNTIVESEIGPLLGSARPDRSPGKARRYPFFNPPVQPPGPAEYAAMRRMMLRKDSRDIASCGKAAD